MRKRLFEIIELSDGSDKLSRFYDVVMMCVIIISLIPLAFKEINTLFLTITNNNRLCNCYHFCYRLSATLCNSRLQTGNR